MDAVLEDGFGLAGGLGKVGDGGQDGDVRVGLPEGGRQVGRDVDTTTGIDGAEVAEVPTGDFRGGVHGGDNLDSGPGGGVLDQAPTDRPQSELDKADAIHGYAPLCTTVFPRTTGTGPEDQ